jgi:predicted permease
VRWPWRGRRARDAELAQEIRDHLDLEAEERQESGAPPREARRAARLAFGNPVTVTEDVREAWGWMWLERSAMDIRVALRMWARTPGFSVVALLTIALGVGASTAIFGQINAVFWKTLSVSDPGELRLVAWTSPRRAFVNGPNVIGGPRIGTAETFGSFSYPAYAGMRDGAQSFTDLACWADLGEARPVTIGELGFGSVQFVSGNFFRMLGVTAHAGRTIEPDDDRGSAYTPIAVLSYRFWQRTYGGDPLVTRQTLRVNGQPFGIVGVTPDGFFGMDPSVTPDVMLPIGAVQVAAANPAPLDNPRIWSVCRVVGRLARDADEQAARQELEHLVADSIAAVPPDRPYDPPRISLHDGSRGADTLREAASAPLLLLIAGVGGLLLASCANIAGLLLARGGAREAEIATRLALGAPRRRIVRQLITESLVLSIAGGVAGVLFAYALSGSMTRLVSQFMPTLFGADRTLSVAAAPDVRVLAFALTVAIVAGLLFGLAPALRTTRLDLAKMIREGSARVASRGPVTSSQAMVAAQTALAIMLLVGAGLFMRTVSNLRSADVGFRPEGLLYARVEPRSGGIAPDKRLSFFESAVKRLAALPGVVAASAATSPSLGGPSEVGAAADAAFQPCTREMVARGLAPIGSRINFVLPGYFDTMGMRLVAGRDFRWDENVPGRASPVIVNEAFAKAFFPGQDPLGQGIGGNCPAAPEEFTVVGVVADGRRHLRDVPTPTFYILLRGAGTPVTLILRTAGDAAALIPTVRQAIRELHAGVPTFSESTLVELRERQLRRERLLSDLLMVFGGVTLFLCSLGIYGMLSYSISRRRTEISVRLAIGAPAAGIVRMVVRESLLPVATGLVLGCTVAFAATRWLDSLLFGVSGADPLTIVGASAVFLLVATAAAALPARAATRVDPVLALRQ